MGYLPSCLHRSVLFSRGLHLSDGTRTEGMAFWRPAASATRLRDRYGDGQVEHPKHPGAPWPFQTHESPGGQWCSEARPTGAFEGSGPAGKVLRMEIGIKLDHFEIIDRLGARAKETQLKRDVALKLLRRRANAVAVASPKSQTRDRP